MRAVLGSRADAAALGAVLAPFLFFAIVFNLTIPVFEAGDEQVHFLYAHYLATRRELPVQSPVAFASPAGPHSSYGPAYYGLVALATGWIQANDVREDIQDAFARQGEPLARGGGRLVHGEHELFAHDPEAEAFPYRGVARAVHVGRLVSTVLGALTVGVAFRTAREVWSGDRAVALAAAALVGLNPQFLYVSATVTSDALVTLLGAVGLLVALRLVRRAGPSPLRLRSAPAGPSPSGRGDEVATAPRPSGGRGPAGSGGLAQEWGWVALGVICGLGLLTKHSGVVLLGLPGLAWLMARLGNGRRRWLVVPLLVAGTFLTVTGWWLVRNQLLYGDPLGWSVYLAGAGRLVSPAPLVLWPGYLRDLFETYWAAFGWPLERAGGWFYRIVVVLVLGALVGLLRLKIRPYFQAGWFMVVLAEVLWFMIGVPSSRQGRLLFPAATALGLLLALGLVGALPARASWPAAVALLFGMVAVDVYAWRWVLAPTFG